MSVRFRCSKTGRFAKEWFCMYCDDPPDDDYEKCININTEYFIYLASKYSDVLKGI